MFRRVTMRFPFELLSATDDTGRRYIAAQHDTQAMLRRSGIVTLALAGSLLGVGCSADISRFEGQSFGLTDSNSAKIPPTGMRQGQPSNLSDQGADGTASPGGAYFPPSSNRDGGLRVSSLPEPSASPGTAPVRAPSIAPRPISQGSVQGAAKPIARGEPIEVTTGDTLYGLAKKHHVTINELMSVNQLKSPNLKPGQKLVLPASRSIAKPAMPQKPIVRSEPPVLVAAVPKASIASQPTAAVVPAPRPYAAASDTSAWDGAYTVKQGDSVYAIARTHKVSPVLLQQNNGITDASKMKPGTVLKVPGSAVAATATPIPVAAPVSQVAGASVTTSTPRTVQSPTRPTIINQQQVAALPPSEPAITAPSADTEAAVKPKGTDVASAGTSAMPAGKFRWPVKGRVIASYGPIAGTSTHNDGVNIAVPLGQDVLAAEQGVVAYAGSQLKGYGNLILIRHDNGWVTAYAHNEELLVQRGDKIRRGQPIAKAGKTGSVDQPQVHFELRQGQKPVDPMPHMEKM